MSIEELRAAIRVLRDGTGDAAVVVTLDRCVLRPLDDLLGRGTGRPSSGSHSVEELALWATRLRAVDGAPHQLLEATAALQTLACAEGSDPASFRTDVAPEIRTAPNGPYLVSNVDDVRDWLGCAVASRPQLALCRCGGSKTKPYCDGTHAENGFRDAKSPDRVPDRRDTYVGQQVTVFDNRGICQHSGFCTDRLNTVFRSDKEPFVAPSGGRMDEIIRAVRDCPSGALSFGIDGVEARDQVDHHDARPPAIEVSKDGPYRVTGGVPLRDGSGDDVSRDTGASREHYALCRCGQSRNKPFCSGMHWYVEFRDPPADPDRTPTMFEWCGGLPALTRMTRVFYEKYVPEDPLLAPLFADMSADHPQRVAAWLGEVFGGPKVYSGQYGGYPRMLSQHVGKGISEEQRSHWVAALLRSAIEAGLPNDAEFRSAFQAYIEWGSRLAVENSHADARPPQHMPMPSWGWTTAAGPPGGRVSALAPPEEETVTTPTLPAPGEPVGFAAHIRPLFRALDRRSMSFAFDLWAYEDVRTHADGILDRLRDGSMPCDGVWPPERVAVFESWVSTGMSP